MADLGVKVGGFPIGVKEGIVLHTVLWQNGYFWVLRVLIRTSVHIFPARLVFWAKTKTHQYRGLGRAPRGGPKSKWKSAGYQHLFIRT